MILRYMILSIIFLVLCHTRPTNGSWNKFRTFTNILRSLRALPETIQTLRFTTNYDQDPLSSLEIALDQKLKSVISPLNIDRRGPTLSLTRGQQIPKENVLLRDKELLGSLSKESNCPSSNTIPFITILT